MDLSCRQWTDCDSVSHRHCVRSWKNLVKLWRAQKLCDALIVVKGVEFHCHSVVPVSCSSFFRAAFLKKAESSSANTVPWGMEVIVDFMSSDTFAQVLRFMYTSEVDIRPITVRPLVLAAARLEMQGMVDSILQQLLDWDLNTDGAFCEYQMSKHKSQERNSKLQNERTAKNCRLKPHFKTPEQTKPICPEKDCCQTDDSDATDAPGPIHGYKLPRDENLTVCGVMDELRLQGDMATLAYSLAFAARNFSKIILTPGYLKASVHTVAAMFDDNRLNMEELDVFLALCKWLESDSLHIVHAPYLLSKIRLKLLSPQELAEHVEKRGYLMKKKKCRVYILEAFRHHCLKSQTTQDGDDIENTTGTEKGLNRRLGNRCDIFDVDDWSIQENSGLVKKDKSTICCPIKPCECCPDYILASGGIDMKEKVASNGVYKYEERENSWLKISSLQEPRNHHALIYAQGALYVLGGSDPSLTGKGAEMCPVSTCHKLSLGTFTWCKIESMSTPRMGLQAAYMNGFIYAIGGQDHKQRILRDVERYCLARKTWEYSGSLSSARAGLAVGIYGQNLWAMGGYCHKSGVVKDTVETFNDDHGCWEEETQLRFPRCFASAAVCKRHLYIIGGAWLDAEMECCNFSSVYDIDIFNPHNKMWEGISALRLGRHDAGVAVLGPRIYIVGGKHCNNGVIKNLDSVECYDIEKSDWIDGITELPLQLLGLAVTYTC